MWRHRHQNHCAVIVCIAEKPSVAKEIAEIIGATSKREGFHEGNGYCVTWTYGHLCTLKEPDDYNPADKRWVISSLPILPERFGIKLISNGGAVRQFKVIERLVKQADQVINCGDAGIEGELIQRWVLAKAGCKAPVMRLWISSLTEEAIREGFKSLKPASDYDLLYAAGNSRAVGDWLLGINATRLYTLKFAQGRGVLSIGRVQTPTLALIVNRDLEINNFVPEKYWELKTRYRGVVFSCEKKKFDEVDAAQTDLASCKEHPLVIEDFSRKKGNEAPPKLLDLTSLQVECNKKYGFSAEDTLQITQKLYERKLLTYPRVDTVYLPNDMYPKIEGIMKGMKHYAQYTEQVLAGKIMKRKQVFDDAKVTDHHAIIPTGVNPDGLALREKQVYDMVARRFLAAFYPDSIVSNTVAKASVGKLPFKATGKQILEDGWRALYPKKADKAEDKSAESEEPDETDRPADSQEMPVFEKGESGPHEPFVQEKQTTPPKPYTEATLLRAMESCGKQIDDEELRDAMKENGIGRPSTRANIIETLFKRKYIEKRRKALCATQVGIDLIRTIQNDLLKSVELTGQWERKLRQIERGEFDARVFIQEMRQMVTELTHEVMSINGQSIIIAEDKHSAGKKGKSYEKRSSAATEPAKTAEKGKIETASSADAAMTCPKCRSAEIVRGKTAFGCKRYNSGCDFLVRFEQFGKTLTDKQLTALIQKGETPVMAGLMIDGKKQKGKVSLNAKFLPEVSAAEDKAEEPVKLSVPAPQPAPQAEIHAPRPLICPKCGQGDMLRGKAAYGCSRYREGCSFTIPFEVLHRSYQTDRLNPDILQKIAGG